MSVESIKQELEMPALGRLFNLGDLYNANTDEIITGYGLWTTEDLQHVSITRFSQTKFTSNTSNKLSDKFKDLDVKGSLQISCLAGLVQLGSGIGNYLNRKITGHRQSSIHVRIRHRTVVKGLDMRKLEQMGFHQLLMDHRGATHAVIQIQYGAEGAFTFTKQLENDEDENQVSGALRAGADNIVNAVLEGETGGGAQVSNLNGTDVNNTEIKCEFEGDFQPFNTKTPTTYDEAIKFSRKFMPILFESIAKDHQTGEPLGVPYTVWLCPLKLMRNPVSCSAAQHTGHQAEESAVHKEMKATDTFECVGITEDYNEIEEQLNSMLEEPLAKKLKPFYEKLQNCKEFVTLFRHQLNSLLAKMLVEIRSGQEETGNCTDRAKQLLDRIKDDHQFPFHNRNLQQWLDQRTKELSKIKRFQDKIEKEMKKISNPNNGKGNSSMKPANVLFFPDMTRLLNQMDSNSSIEFGFEISFWTLLNTRDSFLEQMKQQTREISHGDDSRPSANGFRNHPAAEEEDNGEEPNWYDNHVTLARIETAINVFVKLIKENTNNVGVDESFAFALTAITDQQRNLQPEVTTEPRLFIYTKSGIKIDGSEALLYLCQHYRKDSRLLVDILRLWLDQADIANSRTKDGWNALLLLCRHYPNDNLNEMVQLFADKGININWTNKDGWNALHLACTYYKNEKLVDIVRFLILKKIDAHCKTSEGYDALHLVCQYYNKNNLLHIVGLLLLDNNKADWRVHIDLFNILRKKSQWRHSIGLLIKSKSILLVAITCCLVVFLIIFLVYHLY